MSKQTINIGTTANDKTGDPLRTAFNKINQNFDELYNQQSPNSGVSTFNGNVDSGNPTNLPTDRKIYILNEGYYALGDGQEGQVIYIVPATGITMGWNPQIKIVNARYNNGGTSTKTTDFWWAPFYKQPDDAHQNTLITAAFAGGAWNISAGQQD